MNLKPFLRGLAFLLEAVVLFVVQAIVLQEFFGWSWHLIALVIAIEFAVFLFVALIVDNRTAIGNWMFGFVNSNKTMRVVMTLVFYLIVSFIAWFAPNLDSVYGSMLMVGTSAIIGIVASLYVTKRNQIFTKNGKMAFVLAFVILTIAGITESVVYPWQQWIIFLVVSFIATLLIVKIAPAIWKFVKGLKIGATIKRLLKAVVEFIIAFVGFGILLDGVVYLAISLWTWFLASDTKGGLPKNIDVVAQGGVVIAIVVVIVLVFRKWKQTGLVALSLGVSGCFFLHPYVGSWFQSLLQLTTPVIQDGWIMPLGLVSFALAGFFLIWDKYK